jgi:hypothetical protein
MIGAFWNFIGMNKSGRLSCLDNFVKSNKLDFVGIQETKKSDFANSFLESAGKGEFVPARGTVGWILVCLRSDCFSVLS